MDYKNLKDKLLTNKFKHIIAADIASDVIRIAVVNCSKRINTVEKLISKQLPQELAADAYVFNKEKLAAFIDEILKEENNYSYQIASREKALCDKIYTLKPLKNYSNLEKMLFSDLRIDSENFNKLNIEKIEKLSNLYHSTNVLLLAKYMRRNKNE